MHFTKMHGLGNDYIYINGFNETVQCPEEVARLVSDRHFGIGADGLVMILPSDHADFRMRMFNADGSEGKMCGNAARCIGKYVFERGLTGKTAFTLETESGVREIELILHGKTVDEVCVDMGIPALETQEVPVRLPHGQGFTLPTHLQGGGKIGWCVSMGNPHCVIFSDIPLKDLPLETYGQAIQSWDAFPESVNVEYVNCLSDGTLAMRVYERGSGETLACGTGACAVLVASVLAGKSEKKNTIHLKGGDLSIEWKEDGHVLMRGPAEYICDGEWYNKEADNAD
ncbi:MAG: diaminopimelate epimerase [Clostridia bacterium]|nr:diaminopimelate epimerase [Clostridia bacterium]